MYGGLFYCQSMTKKNQKKHKENAMRSNGVYGKSSAGLVLLRGQATPISPIFAVKVT